MQINRVEDALSLVLSHINRFLVSSLELELRMNNIIITYKFVIYGVGEPSKRHGVNTYFQVLCGEDATRQDCIAPCQRTLPCGHECSNRCSEPCATNCEVRVLTNKCCPYGHQVKLPCSQIASINGNDDHLYILPQSSLVLVATK